MGKNNILTFYANLEGSCWGENSPITLECTAVEYEDSNESDPDPLAVFLIGDEEYGTTITRTIQEFRSIANVSGEGTRLSIGIPVYGKCPSKDWNDIQLTASGIPTVEDFEPSTGIDRSHEHDVVEADAPVFFTVYSIVPEIKEKPWNGDWDAPEDQGVRVVGKKTNGEDILRRWYHLWTVNKNAIRAVVKPQCLGDLVKSTAHTIDSDFVVGSSPPNTILPVVEFAAPHNPPPSVEKPKWKDVLPVTGTYGTVYARIHLKCKVCEANNCDCLPTGSSSGSSSSSSYSCSCSCLSGGEMTLGGSEAVDVVIQKPEFISDIDTAADPQITRENYKEYLTFRAIERGVTPFGANADIYEYRIDPNAYCGTELDMDTPIFAAPRRTVEYSFVADNEIGQELYRTVYDTWSIIMTSNDDIRMFVIDPESGIIRTGTDFGHVPNLPDILSEPFTVRASAPDKPEQFDNAQVIQKSISIAIDATNRGAPNDPNGDFLGPENSPWERLMQTHLYGVGKVVVPNHRDTGNTGTIDCWDGFDFGDRPLNKANKSEKFVPIKITLAPGLDVSKYKVNINYPGTSIIPPGNNPEVPEASDDLNIRIWIKDGDEARDAFFAQSLSTTLLGGDLINPYADYNAEHLGFSDTNRTITLYVEGLRESTNVKYYDDVKKGVKKNLIEVALYDFTHPFQPRRSSDSVQYVVANRNTFYYQMVKRQELRAAVASDGIYGNNNLPQFGLQLNDFISWNPQDQQLVNVVKELVEEVEKAVEENTEELGAGVYFDYCSRKCLVTFQGTNPYSYAHWVGANAGQYIYGKSEQYDAAMKIGLWIHDKETIDPGYINKIIFTGHSLGGGLASAATFFAVPANYASTTTYTFNAAYFRAETGANFILSNPLIINTGPRFLVNFSRAGTNIDPFFVDGEILTFLQKHVLTDNGKPLDTRANGAENGGGQVLGWADHLDPEPFTSGSDPIAALWGPVNRVILHLMPSVFWGLEKLRGIR